VLARLDLKKRLIRAWPSTWAKTHALESVEALLCINQSKIVVGVVPGLKVLKA
jgi:hypothetical protein